jgi:hypothetical protein
LELLLSKGFNIWIYKSEYEHENVQGYEILRIFLAIGVKVIVEWEFKWSYDAGCIINDNWIPGGIWEAVGIRHQHETITHTQTQGRCLALCPICKLFLNSF